MHLRRLIATLSTLIVLGLMSFAPMASALDVTFDLSTSDSDASQGDVESSDCASYDEGFAAAVGCDTSSQVTDFTDYNGSLEGPDASGYDSKLTENTNARDFIQSIVNFALSFLGLIAIVIVIYGGVLYVTSRGDEEATSKAKKAISYAAIGIVIIMGSYAFINTILQAGGGGDTNLGNGTATNGTTVTEAGAAFDVDGTLNEIEDITADYHDVYDTYVTNSEEIAALRAMEMPLIVDVSTSDYTISGGLEFLGEWISGTDTTYSDDYTLISESQIDDYLSKLKTGIQNIEAESDPYSETYERAQALYDYLRSGTTQTSIIKWLANVVVPIAKASELSQAEIAASYAEGSYTSESCAEKADDSSSEGEYRSVGLGVTVSNTSVSEIDDNICPMLRDIQVAANKDYSEGVAALELRLENLGALFDSEDAGFSSNSSLSSIRNGSSGVYDIALKNLQAAESTITSSTVRNINTAMADFHAAVQNLEFVKVNLTASSIEGNAPIIVRFNALGTEDPSGQTVQEDNIQWDLDGDGSFDTQSLNGLSGAEPTGSSVSATYSEAGTYRVRVRVLSASEDIAAGISTVTVVVNPPRSKIVLEATVGTDSSTIADFREIPFVNASSYKVTMAEANAGIEFDASQTTDGNDNTDGIVLYSWDFGDTYTCSGGKSEGCGAVVTHAYGEAGAYTVSLSVTDSTGIEDRKYFTLYVASPAARISYSPETAPVGTTFTFDSSTSSVDVGQIVSRQWSATLNGRSVALDKSTGTSIEQVFTTPGIYTISLTVADNSNKTDTASVDILVESTAPVAAYTYTIPSSTEPATVIFDAEDSYDPDEGDNISYEWDFDGDEGKDYKVLESSSTGDKVTVQYLKKGDYEVSLTVYDSQTGDLRKSDTAIATIPIDSVLDVKLETQGEDAKHLGEDGTVEVEFKATSQNATSFQIDYGDGNSDFSDSLANNQSIFTHTYESAGIFEVTLTALDDENDKNETTRRVYIGAGDAPIAVLNVSADEEDIGSGSTYTGNVNTIFTFDAGASINTDGSNDGLNYSWNFGDGTTATQSSVTHSFREHATYSVTLTVKDKKDPTRSSESSVSIVIESMPPEIHGITTQVDGDSFTTPLKVNVTVDASDEDSKITNYKAWYYDLNDTATELGTVVSQSNSFTITVNTRGEEGETKEYGFAAEVYSGTDTVASFDELDPSEVPTLTVTNGPNDNPVSGFTVDKTSVYVGEDVHFSSTSYDPDGSITKYWWDVEGDGFYNNEAQESGSYTYQFTQVHPDGVEVKLQVEDDAGATSESDPITIYVDSVSDAPDAAFLTNIDGTLVVFKDNSIIDTENGASLMGIYWDFDTSVDSNGNGVVDDDIDSTEESPSHDYGALGSYSAKMTVVDSTGQSDSVEQDITIADTVAPTAAFTYSVKEKTVSFQNNSTVDTAHNVDVRAYSWDLDLNADTDGDSDPENDKDSTLKNPTIEYDDYGSYDVKMTIEDSYGKLDTVTQTIEVPNPIQPVTALLSSVPQANSLSQILLDKDGSSVTFYFSASGGSDSYSYTLDKNIFYDTDGDGVRDNDSDYSASSSGSWKTAFYKSYGQIVTKLTVVDNETGEKDVATLQVVFEGSLGGANLLNATPSQMLLLIGSALLTAILGVSMVFRHKPLP
jgi:PKD repeat protein